MKHIGRTTQGEHLISMTDDELCAFRLLEEAARGKVVLDAYPSDVMFNTDADMRSAFVAVRMWIEQADTVSRLQAGVDRMRDVLGMQGGCTCDRESGEACSECP